MKFKDLNWSQNTFQLEAYAKKGYSDMQGKRVRFVESEPNKYIICGYNPEDKLNIPLTLSSDDCRKLKKIVGSIKEEVVWIDTIIREQKSDRIKIVVCSMSFETQIGNFKFSVGDTFKNKLLIKNKKRKTQRLITIEEIFNKYFIESEGRTFALLGKYNNDNKTKKSQKESYVIKGIDGYLIANEEKRLDGEYIFAITKEKQSIRESDYEFVLMSDVGLVDNSDEGILRRQVEEIIKQDNKKYLNDWKRYGELEEERSYECIKRAGVLHYKVIEENFDGLIRFVITDDDNSESLTTADKIENFAEIASQFPNVDITSSNIVSIGKDFHPATYERIRGSYAPIEMEFMYAHAKSSTVYLKRKDKTKMIPLPKKGSIMLNIVGDCARYKRRNAAIKSTEKGEAGISYLLTLLEGIPLNVNLKSEHYDALTPELSKELFPHKPTRNQIKAIEVALSTPDIALIQGPPGTGKTTVIIAIIKRLIELTAKEEKFWGDNLITSYQHDAVDNVIERIVMDGYPAAMRYGGRNGLDSGEEDLKRNIENWIEIQREALIKKYPDIIENKEIFQYENIYKNFINGVNSLETTINILEKANEIFKHCILVDLVIESEELISELKYKAGIQEDVEYKTLKKVLYRIPTTKNHIEDQGKDWLYQAYLKLNKFSKLSLKEMANELKKAYETDEKDMDDQYFQKLKYIKERLLLKFKVINPVFLDRKKQKRVIDLLERGIIKVQQYSKEKFDPELRIIADYYKQLTLDPVDIQKALWEYAEIVGATCQQAVSYAIVSNKGDRSEYKNVIIDEAARANPLDLLVPASKAVDRIILVGDHRQLPHIVEEEILDKIEDEKPKGEKLEDLEESIFERLYKNLKAMEEKDGIKRVVTLDSQFRMHPVLGNFVSENFYENTDGVKIHSPRGAEQFTHEVPGLENKACVWLDVPYDRGREGNGKSKSRRVEAEQIAKHIKSIIDSPKTQNLSFGIITFYRKQVDIIMEALSKYGITELDPETNRYKIVAKYKFIGEKEKLLIGTVDAFQGKEFDVVYLSIVRSNKKKNLSGKYGHLIVPNRLCVSMSRQKKLLIAVGDSQMFIGKMAGKVEQLTNFYQMCMEDKDYGKILNFME